MGAPAVPLDLMLASIELLADVSLIGAVGEASAMFEQLSPPPHFVARSRLARCRVGGAAARQQLQRPR